MSDVIEHAIHSAYLTGIPLDYRISVPRCVRIYHTEERERDRLGVTPAAFEFLETGNENTANDIYRAWASRELSAIIRRREDIAYDLNSAQAFDAWHAVLVERLKSAWADHAEEGFEIENRRAYNLVNLFLKWLGRHATAPGLKDVLLRRAHVVVNSRIEAILAEVFAGRIPAYRSSFTPVEFDAWYRSCQECVRELTAEDACGGTPVLFDIYCREMTLGGGAPGRGGLDEGLVGAIGPVQA